MAAIVKQNLPISNVMIVDALNLAFRWKHNGSAVFANEYLNTVLSLARSYDCGQIIIAADQSGSSYRKDLYPEYKANRKQLADAQTAAEREASRVFFDEYEKALELLDSKFTLLRYSGVEADDIAAYIVSRMPDYGIDHVWLISSDRDWDLLIKDNVKRFSTVTRKEITLETWPYDVPPEHYLSFKCLVGDKGDNIPGVPGVGEKRAAGLIEQYGSAHDIADAIPLPGKYVYIQNVNKCEEQIRLNYELMDLEGFCQDAIGADNLRDIGMRLMMNERFEHKISYAK